ASDSRWRSNAVPAGWQTAHDRIPIFSSDWIRAIVLMTAPPLAPLSTCNTFFGRSAAAIGPRFDPRRRTTSRRHSENRSSHGRLILGPDTQLQLRTIYRRDDRKCA